MRMNLRSIILYCDNHICGSCKFYESASNVCNARVNGELPCSYKTLLDGILKYPKIAQDIYNDVEVEIDENNSERTY